MNGAEPTCAFTHKYLLSTHHGPEAVWALGTQIPLSSRADLPEGIYREVAHTQMMDNARIKGMSLVGTKIHPLPFQEGGHGAHVPKELHTPPSRKAQS